MNGPYDDLVYDGGLGWIDPDPAHLLDSIGVERRVSGDSITYHVARQGHAPAMTLTFPLATDWAVLRAIVDDAERYARQDPGRRDGLDS